MINAVLAASLLGLGSTALALQSCAESQYDPAQYFCWEDQFLCPVIAGEGLRYCSGACYSTFQYQCQDSVLQALPLLEVPFTLTVQNPSLVVHNQPISASGLHWYIGGPTSSYCPSPPVTSCPPGNVTVMVAGEGGVSMQVTVPGGQQVYLNPNWSMAYTQAHSAYIPPGSTRLGFAAYAGGGLVNLNGNGWPWVACPPGTSGGDNIAADRWNLVAKNSTNAASLVGCTNVNLKTNVLPPGSYTWQYT